MSASDILANVDEPRPSNNPITAIKGRLEHLRDLALSLHNLGHHITRALLDTSGLKANDTFDCEEPVVIDDRG